MSAKDEGQRNHNLKSPADKIKEAASGTTHPKAMSDANETSGPAKGPEKEPEPSLAAKTAGLVGKVAELEGRVATLEARIASLTA
jgi:hypothetical protein